MGGEGFGDHLVFHRERRGREAIVANGVYGGNSRKLIANKPPMRGGGVINITEPYEGGRGKIGRFYDDRT